LALAIVATLAGVSRAASDPPALVAARRSGPILIDGRLNEPSWDAAPVGEGFRQNQPDEGAPASAATRFRVLWDDEALYIGVDCDEPAEPTVVLGRRDHPLEADAITVILDTQLDRRTAYRFTVYAAGQQLDGLHYDDVQLTTDWDATWDSAVARTPGGWSVELRLPLRVLRIPDGATEFGLNVLRARPAAHEESTWRFTPRGTPGLVSQLGRLRGIDGIRPVRAIELRPYVATTVSHISDATGTAPGLFGACSSLGVADATVVRACAGADFKVGLTSDLALVGTVNPDFGQVEADQRVLNLTTFETQFPEKRPFFLEGLDLFQPPVRMTDWGGEYGSDAFLLFYSRRIGAALGPPQIGAGETVVYQPSAQPVLAAVKLAGQLGPATVTALSAVESETTAQIRGADGTIREVKIADAAHIAALRVRTLLGERGVGGVTATAYDPIAAAGARHAYAGAGDLTLFDDARDYNLAMQVVGSLLEGGAPELQLDGNTLHAGSAGLAASARAAKDGGWLGGFVDVDWLSPELSVDALGFQRRANLTRAFAAVTVRDLHPTDLWNKATVTLSEREIRTADLGLTLYRDIILEPNITLNSFWTVTGDLMLVPARGDDRELGDGTPVAKHGGWGVSFDVKSDPARALAGELGSAAFFYGPGTVAEVYSSTTLHPIPSIEAQLELDYNTTRDEVRRLRGATTVPDSGAAPMPLDPATATESQRLYLFAPQSAQGVSATLRGTLALSPRLTLQLYSQLFTAGISYGAPLRAVAQPGKATIDLAALEPARAEDQAPASDTRQASFNLNLILRWEWRTGSTLYVVYGHATNGTRSLGPGVGLSFAEELDTLGAAGAGSVDTMLVKIDFPSAL
jgi:hypothetical protein